jgi:hypothetical protein
MVDEKKTMIMADDNNNLKAAYVLFAIKLKSNHKDEVFKDLKRKSTKDLPLGAVRVKEWIAALKVLYFKCFTPMRTHIFPMMYTDHLLPMEKRDIELYCYKLLAEEICMHLFNNVNQVIYKGWLQVVPGVEGKCSVILSSLL